MYLWALAGHDLREEPILSGVSGDLAAAMRAAEPMLKDGRAFIAIIREVGLRISVAGLEETYVATGRSWIGRRAASGGVHWSAMSQQPDPETIYRIPRGLDRIPAEPPAGAGQGDRAGAGTRPDGGSPSGHAPR